MIRHLVSPTMTVAVMLCVLSTGCAMQAPASAPAEATLDTQRPYSVLGVFDKKKDAYGFDRKDDKKKDNRYDDKKKDNRYDDKKKDNRYDDKKKDNRYDDKKKDNRYDDKKKNRYGYGLY